ncbi:complexin-like [Oppia nitens]|uniref:complexin-like n=1 Tax=Oppia nitens TaxID=1686743 RepID=UPI0023DB1EC3|nr:complexin-like [Oppia nitens]
MAAFIAKQMVGNQLSAVKDIGGGESMTAEEKERLAQLEQERLEALREQEERRKEKHRKIEVEREKMRKGIRDKYNIKKKEQISREESIDAIKKQDSVCSESGLNRRKKTPEEMTAEAEEADLDDFSKFKNSLEHRFSELKNSIESRCVIQ